MEAKQPFKTATFGYRKVAMVFFLFYKHVKLLYFISGELINSLFRGLVSCSVSFNTYDCFLGIWHFVNQNRESEQPE